MSTKSTSSYQRSKKESFEKTIDQILQPILFRTTDDQSYLSNKNKSIIINKVSAHENLRNFTTSEKTTARKYLTDVLTAYQEVYEDEVYNLFELQKLSCTKKIHNSKTENFKWKFEAMNNILHFTFIFTFFKIRNRYGLTRNQQAQILEDMIATTIADNEPIINRQIFELETRFFASVIQDFQIETEPAIATPNGN